MPARPRTVESGFVAGAPLDEAKSLLRPCLPHGEYKSGGKYGKPLASLPSFLAGNVATGVKISLTQLQKYLVESDVPDADLGGQIGTALPNARYLVIHDTSYKLGKWLHSFPADINTSGWTHNKRSTFKNAKDAHVFISRLGESNTAHDFVQPFSATKYTNLGNTPQARALKSKFCHVELIQPRLGNLGVEKSDWIAPSPGFTGAQLDRLALVYTAASFRHGEWLIPAYHHNVDIGFAAHDDPQNFDLKDWDNRINEIVKDIVRVVRPGDFPTGTIHRQSG
jgi:hypothetical protein